MMSGPDPALLAAMMRMGLVGYTESAAFAGVTTAARTAAVIPNALEDNELSVSRL
jgi:hypothetical protein